MKVRLASKCRKNYHPGDVLPQGFVVDAIVGEGGSGVVLKAHKPAIQPPIYKAIKVINANSVRESGDRQAIQAEFHGEARVSNQLGGDPYAVAVEDILEMSDGTRALVYPFIQGHALASLNADHIGRGQFLPFELTAFVFHRILSVLVHAQELGIAHRDLCPNNVMVQRTGVPLLLDWGAGTEACNGLIVGKVGYIAPEIVLGDEELSPTQLFKADVFSLGALIRELLVGFNALAVPVANAADDDVTAALERGALIDSNALPPASDVCADIPAKLAGIVAACLRRNASDRPSAEALYDELGAAYLYSPQVGFGLTAETLKDYLAFFYAPEPRPAGRPLPDNKLGRSLEKLVLSKVRRKAEAPEYQGRRLKEVGQAENLAFHCDNVGRGFREAFGLPAYERAVRAALLAWLYRDQPRESLRTEPVRSEYEHNREQLAQAPLAAVEHSLRKYIGETVKGTPDEIAAHANRQVFMHWSGAWSGAF
ncbi:MAG: protein kinase [Lentisphaerae bacterium]|nr:protein kinase [Lentisphaerota bacterium]